MAHHQPFQVTGFHSCDKEIGIAVLNGKMELQPSNNAWDWLGGGIYFWEQNPDRAMEYAMESAMGKQYNKVRIKTPLVIGTTIELGNCLNLIEPESLAIIEDAYKGMEKVILDQHQALPINSGSKRELDCAVIKYVHKISKLKSLPAYDTIRSAFQEGREVYPKASFTTRLHIQICVINPLMIKGYFLPRPLEQYNPYLNRAFNQ